MLASSKALEEAAMSSVAALCCSAAAETSSLGRRMFRGGPGHQRGSLGEFPDHIAILHGLVRQPRRRPLHLTDRNTDRIETLNHRLGHGLDTSDFGGAHLHGLRDLPNLGAQELHCLGDFASGAGTRVGELAHLVSHNGEPSSMFPGPGGLDSGR